MSDIFVIKGIIIGLGIAAGAFCIWLGYRLYAIDVREKGKAHLRGEGFGEVTLSDYGPGVVFSLFGACLIVFCVTRDFTRVSTSTTTTTQANSESVDGSTGTYTIETVAESAEEAADAMFEAEEALAEEAATE